MTFYAISLSLAVLAGAALGLFYFGGLWLTVRRLAGSRRPGMLMLGSFVVRLLVTLCGFYLVMDDSWERLLAGLAGFLVARVALTRALGKKGTVPL
ncbi:MAG: ATP synthase subunit I [Deltaproteobacteria bacterium]|nr:ATP synthase subunit I [Deltaproteobacteria bacterium]